MAFSPVKYKQQRPRTETANWVTSRVRLWQRNVWRSSDWQMWISNLDEGWGGVEGQVTRPKSLQVQQCNVWAYKSKHRDLDNWVSISNFKINLIHYWVVKIFQLIFNKSLYHFSSYHIKTENSSVSQSFSPHSFWFHLYWPDQTNLGLEPDRCLCLFYSFSFFYIFLFVL